MHNKAAIKIELILSFIGSPLFRLMVYYLAN